MPRKAMKKRNYVRGRRRLRKYGNPIMRSLAHPNKVYAFKRLGKTLILQNSTTAGSITTNDAALVNLGTAQADTVGSQFGAGMTFRLANLETPADFTSLFDQYKIKGVKVKIIPLSDSANANNNSFLPTLYWRVDNDDGGFPTTEGSIREAQDVKTMRLNTPKSIYIPYPKSAVDTNGTVSAYGSVASRWINTTDSTAFHYGLKLWIKNADLRAQPTVITAFRIEVCYYLLFRGVQ